MKKSQMMICPKAKECDSTWCICKKPHEENKYCSLNCSEFGGTNVCIPVKTCKTKKEQKNMNRDSSGRFIKKSTSKTNTSIPTPEEFTSKEIPSLKTLFKNNPDMLTMINAAVSFIPGFKKSAEDMEITSLKYMMENMPEMYKANRETALALYNKLGFSNAAKIVMDDILK